MGDRERSAGGGTHTLVVAPVPHGGLAALLYGMAAGTWEAVAAAVARRGGHPRPLGA